MKAIDIFCELEKGILQVIKAADIYLLHLLAEFRNGAVDMKTVNDIVKYQRVSVFNIDGNFYGREEIEFLEKHGQIKSIGQQIVLSCYTVLEIYLIEKFKEYYRYILKDKADDFIENSLRRITFRSIKDDIKDNYFDLLNIHLPSFEIEYSSNEKSSFQPQSSWEAILLISKARNEIAHCGESRHYNIATLLDSWYHFEFVRRWVDLFQANFDPLIYENKEYPLIQAYKKRLSK